MIQTIVLRYTLATLFFSIHESILNYLVLFMMSNSHQWYTSGPTSPLTYVITGLEFNSIGNAVTYEF